MNELKRVCNWRFFLIVIIGVVVNILSFYFQNAGENNKQYYELVEVYKNFDLTDALSNIEYDIKNIDESIEKKREMYSVRQKLQSKIKYLSGYESKVERIIEIAKKNQTKRLFSDTNSYSYINAKKTETDFERVKNVKVELLNDRWVEEFLNYRFIYILIYCMALFVVFQFNTGESKALEQLLYSAPNGRFRYAISRFFTLSIVAFFIQFILFSTSLVESGCAFGFDTMLKPIQTIEKYATFSRPWNQIEYIIFLFFVAYLSEICMLMITWLLYTALKAQNIVTLSLGLLFGVEYILLKKIDVHSDLVYLKNNNIFNLFYVDGIISKYKNIQIFDEIVSLTGGVIVLQIIIVIVALFVCMLLHVKRYPSETGKDVRFHMKAYLSIFYQKILSKMPLWYIEVHKMLFTGKGGYIIVVSIIVILFAGTILCRDYTIEEIRYENIYKDYGGEKADFIYSEIEEKRNDYLDAEKRQEEVLLKYQSNDATIDEYYAVRIDYGYYWEQYMLVQPLEEKSIYIDRIKAESGINAWMISDSGYDIIFGPDSYARETVIMMIYMSCIYLIGVNVASIEKNKKMNMLLKASINGKVELEKRKKRVYYFSVLVLDGVFFLIKYICLKRKYGIPFNNAPLASLSFFKMQIITGVGNIPIAAWMGLQVIVYLIVTLIVARAAMAVSKKIYTDKGIVIIIFILAGVLGFFLFALKMSYNFCFIMD